MGYSDPWIVSVEPFASWVSLNAASVGPSIVRPALEPYDRVWSPALRSRSDAIVERGRDDILANSTAWTRNPTSNFDGLPITNSFPGLRHPGGASASQSSPTRRISIRGNGQRAGGADGGLRDDGARRGRGRPCVHTSGTMAAVRAWCHTHRGSGRSRLSAESTSCARPRPRIAGSRRHR